MFYELETGTEYAEHGRALVFSNDNASSLYVNSVVKKELVIKRAEYVISLEKSNR